MNPVPSAYSKLVTEPGHLDFLVGIRGLAALWVLVAHCMIWGGWYALPLPDPKIAVDIFMVVSGFLMVHVAQARSARKPPGSKSMTYRFWVRRFFRIAPLYYLVLGVAFVKLGRKFLSKWPDAKGNLSNSTSIKANSDL